jgi:DNA-3-methyladenine glycosylase II
MIKTLDENNLITACKKLSKQDKDLAFIFQTYGLPPLWERESGFATLIHIILEQQVSVASALSAFDKLRGKLNGEITPENLLSLSDAEMKAAYFSRQKIVYARDLAQNILNGNLDLNRFGNLSNEEIKHELKKIKGIGDWTADIYLLMAMLRTDVMPKGDLALHIAWQRLKRLELRPTSDEFLQIAERWKPLRSVAARLLWHFYLNAKKF